MYAVEMHKVVNCHGILFRGFADDSQLSQHMLVHDIHVEKRQMADSVADMELWCRCHRLKLNADQSDIIWLGTRQQLAKISQSDEDFRALYCERQPRCC